ncbi:hypothetical protein T484DRAFT_1837392 [Baffinella frigidus]|nr:hypothetical protein T484DRAFT_1837392 [Cryptophyta sp. CCMP2293]
MATRSLCLLVLSLLACSLVAPADALWFGSHFFANAARPGGSPGDVKPLSDPLYSFQVHIIPRDVSHDLETSRESLQLGKFLAVGVKLLSVSLVAPVAWSLLSTFLFSIAALRGDVTTLRLMVHAGQEIDSKDGWSALRIATFAGQPAAIRLLLEEGAETIPRYGSAGKETELEMARRLLALHKEERSRKGLSWKQKNPTDTDPTLIQLSECVELLRDPTKPARDAKVARQLLVKNPPKAKASSPSMLQKILQRIAPPKAKDSSAILQERPPKL